MQRLVLLVCAAASACAQTPTTIGTPFGAITGLIQDQSRVFRGVPFADPTPRWESPNPLTPWTTVYDATFERPSCPQVCGLPQPACPTQFSENCLFLTISTPLEIAQPLPVMVFLHGGNFVDGSGSVQLYDGTFFANQTNTILVGVNYRLGALGYMSIPEQGVAGNAGLKDQILALQWVQTAISAFGGDPSQVTVFGQSAGGTSIGSLLTSNVSQGLYQQAIVQSNPFGLKIRTPETAADVAASFVQGTTRCDGNDPNLRACLDALTVDEILTAQQYAEGDIDLGDFIANFYKWTPIVDGDLVLDQPITAWRAREIPDLPIYAGHTSEEGVQYGYAIFTSPVSRLEYILIATILFSHLPVLDAYPASLCDSDPVQDCRQLLSRAITDYIWICPTRSLMRGMAQGLQGPHYQYRFDHAWSFQGWDPIPGEPHYCDGFACHGGELPFVFDVCFINDQFPPELQCDADEDILGDKMGRSWGNFAHTANPNIDSLPDVPTFGAGEGDDWYLVFDTANTGIVNDLIPELCDMMDEAGYHPETPLFRLSDHETLRKAGWTGPNRSGKQRTMRNFRMWLNETYGPFPDFWV